MIILFPIGVLCSKNEDHAVSHTKSASALSNIAVHHHFTLSLMSHEPWSYLLLCTPFISDL